MLYAVVWNVFGIEHFTSNFLFPIFFFLPRSFANDRLLNQHFFLCSFSSEFLFSIHFYRIYIQKMIIILFDWLLLFAMLLYQRCSKEGLGCPSKNFETLTLGCLSPNLLPRRLRSQKRTQTSFFLVLGVISPSSLLINETSMLP